MPLLPIPPCVDSFVGGKDLKDGLKHLCIFIIVLSLLPILITFILCHGDGDGHKFSSSDPVGFATGFALILAIIVIICLFLEDSVPSIVHFILWVVWVCVTILVVSAAIYLVTHHSDTLFDGTCGIGLFLNLLCFIFLTVAMVYGIIVYWSFYAESD